MKILVLNSFYPPLSSSGHAERCAHVVSELATRGHRVQVLTSNYRVPPVGLTQDGGVFREFTLYPQVSETTKEALSYRDIYALERSHSAILHYRIKRFSPDVIFIWDASGLSKSMLFQLEGRGVPVVYDIHNEWLKSEAYEADPWYWWWRKNTKFSARGRRSWMYLTGGVGRTLRQIPIHDAEALDLSHAVVISQSLRDSLVADGRSRLERATVACPALKANSTLRKKQYVKERRFMWAGRLSEGKAPDLALKAVALLKARNIRVTLDIFGMGQPIVRKQMREQIEQLGLSETVQMQGIRPGELGTYYGKYDALLFTSRCDDPFATTPLEAMYSGLPCILAKDGGVQEIVEDGETALLFECDDAEALAGAMLRFMELPDAGQALAQKCTESLHTCHSMDTYLKTVESMMDAAIKNAS